MTQTNALSAGAFAGVIAGVVFGIMMGMMGMLPMVAKLVSSDSVAVGFITHLVFSTIIGVGFAFTLGMYAKDTSKAWLYGLVYGAIWWVLGPLIIMPLWLGMGIQLSAEGVKMALPSLWGHLVYGLILGVLFPLFLKEKAQ